MKQRGFTLLEMLIGLTLLGFILLLLYNGLRLGTKSWDVGERLVEGTSRQAVVMDFLRRQLAQAYPLRWKREGVDVMVFSGEPKSLRFAAQIPAHLGTGGLHVVELEAIPGNEAEALRMRWRLPTKDANDFAFSDEDDQATLWRAMDGLEIAYFGAPRRDDEAAWHDSWHSDERLPRLVRLRIAQKDGKRWPDLLVDLSLATLDCNWHPVYKRCL